MINPKDGDIYRWRYSDSQLKDMDYKIDAGTLYWCCSQICVFKNGKFVDTYWTTSDTHNNRFEASDVPGKYIVEYVENFDNLIKANKQDRAYYNDSDCVDISHANMTGGGFYIRKGAKKSLEKMAKIMNRKIYKLQRDISYAESQLESAKKELLGLTIDSRLHVTEEVSLYDHSYEDEAESQYGKD